jgi:hypothetical protein
MRCAIHQPSFFLGRAHLPNSTRRTAGSYLTTCSLPGEITSIAVVWLHSVSQLDGSGFPCRCVCLQAVLLALTKLGLWTGFIVNAESKE